MNRKKILTIALIVIILAMLSYATLAWFTDSKTVSNKFMVAGSEDQNPDKIFSVSVWEDVNGDGVKDTVEGHTYNNILPGAELDKEVHVENTGSYDQYIRVTVEFTDLAAWKNALGADYSAEKLLTFLMGYDATAWYQGQIVEDTTADTVSIRLYYQNILTPGNDVVVFEAFQVPTSLTQAQAALFAGGFEVNVTGEAVQTENLGVDTTDTVCDALEAFTAAEA